MDTFSFDHLGETEFENFCYDLLGELGFVNINWRKGTGFSTSPADRGRDIECELHRPGLAGKREIERWFVECKHHKEGVSPDKISGALSWAYAERPDRLLIIASNFLSNPTKDHIEIYKQKNKPSFKIDYWESRDIQRLTEGKTRLLRKYRISGDFPYLSLLHPVHIKCLRAMPLNTLGYFFECVDKLDAHKRDEIFGYMYEMILHPQYREAVTGKETRESLRIDEVNYDLFKKRCYQIAGMHRIGGIDGMQLVYFIVSFVLQQAFSLADSTNLDERIDIWKLEIAYHQKQIEEGEGDFEENMTAIEHAQRYIDGFPDIVKRNYELYTYLCENLIGKLFAEKYLLTAQFKPETEEDVKLYNFTLRWFREQAEREQQKPTKAHPTRARKTKKANSTTD